MFVKGDLQVNEVFLFSCNKVSSDIADIKNKFSEQEKDEIIIVKVKLHTDKENFTGTGFPVLLYNSSYKKVAESQIINGYIIFRIKQDNNTEKTYKAVCHLTSDEAYVSKGVENVLNLYY